MYAYQWQIQLREAGSEFRAFVDYLGHVTGAENPGSLSPKVFRSRNAAIDFWAATATRKIPGQGSREWIAKIVLAEV